jgi:pimeloyl-ACP methyl ester carboxylesterase
VAFHPRTEASTWSVIRHLMQRSPRVGLATMMSSLSTLPVRRVLEDLTGTEKRELTAIFASMRSGSGFLNDVRHPVDPELERRVVQPTLVAASRTDGQVQWEHALSLQRNIPGSQLWQSPSLSHLLWYGSGAQATARKTASFLATHGPQPSHEIR